MRAFQFTYLFIFLLFYLFISFGTFISLSKIVQKSYRKKVRWIVSVYTIVLILAFIFLYVWPFSASNTQNYSANLIYNALLSMDFAFKIPLTISFLFGLILFRFKKPVIHLIGLVIAICLSSSVVFGTFFGDKELIVNELELKFNSLPAEFDGYRILQYSDTHLGSFLNSKKLMNKTVKEIDKLNPSIVLFTGDLVNNFSNEVKGWDKVFEKINANRKSYAILGNHDYGNYSSWKSETAKKENFSQIIDAHKSFGFNLMRNENYKLREGKDSIYIIGVENWGHAPFPQYANLDKAMVGIPRNSFKILLTHDPAHWESVVKERQDIQLSLAGHTHGLQWGIKKAGITFSLSYFIRKNWGGFYQYGNSQLYVNTGLGMVGIPWRINMPGELTLITLKRVEIE